jgi:dipeptidyl aminopeptidase/acylaminoacyl peptidase
VWLGVDSDKLALSRPARQRVTQAVGPLILFSTNDDMVHRKKFSVTLLLAFLVLLIQSSCSKEVLDMDSIVNCSNGTNPVPVGKDFQFPGDLLLLRSDHSEILAFNGETHKLTSVFKMSSDDFYDVSPLFPNGDKLVLSYQKPPDKETLFITILSNHGIVETKSIPFPVWGKDQKKPNAWISVDWVNSSYLLGELFDQDNHEDNVWEPWLLNLDRLEWESLSNKNKSLDPIKNSLFSISPDMTKVLYLNEQYQLVLYDFSQNKAIWTYSDYDWPKFLGATWSKDGKILATINAHAATEYQPAILVLDQNGEILHLMNIGTMPSSLSWSNDAKSLFFWAYQSTGLNATSGSRPILRMIDMNTGLAKDLCMLSENVAPVGSILWSPDQKFLAYNLQDNNAKRNKVIIQKLNDPQLRAIQLDDETPYFEFLGWSKEHWSNVQP